MLEKLLNSDKIRELQQGLQQGDSVLIEDLWNAPKALIGALAQQATGKHVLIITGAGQEETRLYHDFPFFTSTPVIDFPAWETLPTENIAPSPDIIGERYQALRKLSNDKTPYIILTSLQACLQKLIPPTNFNSLYLHLVVGKTYPFNGFIDQLVKMGYQRSSIASDKGQFAVRGGIIDIFPVSSPDPFRLEFWEDDLESMRIYDPIGQKSVKHVQEIEITAAQEMELISQSKRLCTILDYLGPNTVIICDDLLALEDRYASLTGMTGGSSPFFCNIEEFLDKADGFQKIFLSQQPIEELSDIQLPKQRSKNFYSETASMQEISFEIFNRKFSAKRWLDTFLTITEFLLPNVTDPDKVSGQEIVSALNSIRSTDFHLYVICPTELEEASFHRRLQNCGISLPRNTTFQLGYLSNGIVIDDLKIAILPLTEITKRYKIRRQKQRSTYHTSSSDTYNLTPGEMVVHYANGIGRFLGVEKHSDHSGTENEFLSIEYADNAKLFVPINQMHLVNKYIGSGEEVPKMHSLGNLRWKKTRENAEKAILAYAHELLDLYAIRSIKGGFKYEEDSPEMIAFEDDFPYTETEDQLKAIADIKHDMTSEKAMDRLICGDVGYGKTEVAMRTAFKAVVDGKKQVAVLVPTTVLAMQHYENFIERFSNFPVNITVLSRFRSAKEIRASLEGIANGSIDIVIGTHRIIGKDVVFKDLGLIIIDEEQRFGVAAKEHLKKMKVNADCLTLSATPIPRTLYMSLVGARDMSVINTPPQDRLPITTIVTESNHLTIKNALLRELARDGQAYIIHNRVETIFDYAAHIKEMIPQARIVVGHGQMSSDELDGVFHAFKSGQADILIATTIVENGIDIPNANTILIDRADRFGMADLYQLRGRVGRWNRRAYAYLFVPTKRVLAEIVEKRLTALAASSGYGGGMKVAMHDLEIRGAGNILGFEQSGQVSSIGFHLYCKLLKRAVLVLQGKMPHTIADTKIEFPVDARIPEYYVEEASLRMAIYQRFGEAISQEEIDEIWAELKDRFGVPPEPALWLYHLTRIRAHASKHGVTLIKQDKYLLRIERQEGKQLVSKKFPCIKLTSPQELEKQVTKILANIIPKQ